MSAPDDQPHTRTRYPAGTPSPGAPEAGGRRSLRTLVAVLAMVAVLVLAVAVLNRTGGSTTAAGSTPSSGAAKAATGTSGDQATAPTGTQPVTTTQNGIATGFPHTSEGAQSAAVNYAVALGSADMYNTAKRHTIVATVADPSAVSKLNARFDPSYATLGSKFDLKDGQGPNSLTFVSRTVPVGTKTDGYNADTAVIEVWTTGLIGLAGTGSAAPVTEFWQTSTLHLHWTGDWKVADVSAKDGPTPISGSQTASSAQDIVGAVTQFGGFRYAR